MRTILSELVIYITNHLINSIPSHILRKAYYRRVLGAQIGRDSYIFLGATFDTRRGVVIGDNCVVNARCRLDNRGGIYIGNNVAISSEVQVITADHDPRSATLATRVASVKILDHVFIGTRATILPGVTLGRGCVVAAGSIVTKSVADDTIVAGVPAKQIGTKNCGYDYVVNYGRLFQ